MYGRGCHSGWPGWPIRSTGAGRVTCYPLVRVLLTACPAVMAGARSFVARGQWAKAAPQDTLVLLVARTTAAFNLLVAPSAALIRRG